VERFSQPDLEAKINYILSTISQLEEKVKVFSAKVKRG